MTSRTFSPTLRADEGPLLLGAQELGHRAQRIGLVEKAVLAHPLVVEDLRQVLLSAVGQQHEDVLLALRHLRVLDGPRHRRPRATAHEQPLLPHQLSGHEEAFLVVDAHDVVDDLEVHGRRQEVLPDAFDVIGERAGHPASLHELVVERADGVDAHQSKAGLLLLEEAAASRDGPARSHAGHEDVDLAGRLFPDLRGRGEVVGFGVGGVVVLVRVERARRLLDDALGRLVVAARILRLDGGRADHHARTGRPQRLHLLQRHLVGHDEDAAVAAQGRHQGQSHARVAAGRLDDGATRPEQAAPLCIGDDVDGHPVLHRPAGVQVLALDVDVGGHVTGHLLQLDDGRVPDRL